MEIYLVYSQGELVRAFTTKELASRYVECLREEYYDEVFSEDIYYTTILLESK